MKMHVSFLSVVVLCSWALRLSAVEPASAPTDITESELVRRTQELFDAVAPGDRGPWEKYYADDCLFFDEKGRQMNKETLVADVQPLPPGYAGSIKVVRVKSLIFTDTAVLSYDLDETETIFGQALAARYHATDTWRKRNGSWQIVATQVLRFYEDPPEGKAEPAKWSEYTGKYHLGPERTLQVVVKNGALWVVRTARPDTPLITEAGDLFFSPGVEGRTFFHRTPDGNVDSLLQRRNNQDVAWKKD